jgi:hypothetical protein
MGWAGMGWASRSDDQRGCDDAHGKHRQQQPTRRGTPEQAFQHVNHLLHGRTGGSYFAKHRWRNA